MGNPWKLGAVSARDPCSPHVCLGKLAPATIMVVSMGGAASHAPMRFLHCDYRDVWFTWFVHGLAPAA